MGWNSSLRDAALERRPGAAREAVEGLPGELAALYREMDGATLLGEVRLFPLAQAPFPSARGAAWQFGQKGAHQHLFALPRTAVAEALGEGTAPTWMPQVLEDEWIYGMKEGATGPLRLFRTLNSMLGVLVPPPVEEFGEATYARALSTVQAALEDLSTPDATALVDDEAPVRPAKRAPRRAPKKAKRPAPRKAAPKKRPVRRTAKKPAAKKKTPARAKSKPARKPAKKAGRKPSPRGARRR
jgi:hypothetical protein